MKVPIEFDPSMDKNLKEDSAFFLSQYLNPQSRAIYRVITLAALILGSYAIYNFYVGNFTLAIIETLFTTFAIAIIRLGSSGKISIKTIASLLSLCTLLFFTYLTASGKAYGTGIYWGLLFPFFVFFLNGMLLGLAWSIAYLLANVSALIFLSMGGYALPHIPDILIRAAIAYGTCTAFAYFYEQQHFKNRLFIQHSGDKFKRLIENSTDIITIVDPTGEFLFISPSSESILGYKPSELIGANAFKFLHPDDRMRIGKKLTRVILNPGLVEKDEAKFKRPDGSWCDLGLTGKAHISTDSTITAVINAHDITDKKQLEAQFLQTQKLDAIGTLVGGIAHDLNNKFAAMRGMLYLAKREAKENPPLLKKINGIDQITTKSAEVIQQLLTFASKDMVKIESYSINSFLVENDLLFRGAISKHMDLKLDICPDQLNIRGDKAQCRQAIVNLLINAKKALNDQSQPVIKISLQHFIADENFQQLHHDTQQQEFAHLIIEDNGFGIKESDMPHIFEPFFTTREVGKGSGLGLSMAYGCVTRHGGFIEVESELEKGTAVHIYMPTVSNSEITGSESELGNSPTTS